MVEYQIYYSSTYYPVTELEIKYTGTELDEIQFVSTTSLPLNALLTIYYGTTVVMYAYVKDIEEIEQGALYKHTGYELVVNWKTRPYLSGGLDIFSKGPMHVDDLVTDILTGTSWTLDTSCVDTTNVTINFYMVNVLQALNKVLREIRGYYVLFDSATAKVKFLNGTTINHDLTGAGNIIYLTKTLTSSSMLRGITQVTVIGKDSSVRGDYGSSTTSRVYYQVDDIETNAEALSIATAIYGDIGVNYSKYKLTLDPSQIQYDVRDKVAVDGVNYWVTEVTQSIEDVTLLIDTGKTSVVESLGSRIHKIEGDFPEGSDVSWSGGNSNVAANGTTETTYVFDITDAVLISNAELDVTISNFDKNVESVTAAYLSAPSVAAGQGAATDITTFGSPLYLPNTSGLACGAFVEGSQFGTVSFDLQILADEFNQCYAELQYKYYGGSWTAGRSIIIDVDTSWKHYCLSFLFDGTSYSETAGTTGLRLCIYPCSGSTLFKMTTSYVAFSRVPRHIHTLTTTDNRVVGTNTPAATVLVKLNSGGTYTSVTPGTPQVLSTFGTLVSGKNIIYVKTPSGTSNMCSVNPTIKYQTLGKS